MPFLGDEAVESSISLIRVTCLLAGAILATLAVYTLSPAGLSHTMTPIEAGSGVPGGGGRPG
jgi:hypothetical protein